MKNIYIISVLVVLASVFSSCDKFLDIKPKGIIIPEKVTDYELLLNSPTLTETFPLNLLDFTDDNFNKLDNLNISPTACGYYWKPILTVNEKASPDVWGPMYRAVYDCNIIINGVSSASDGMADQKLSILAEALVIRSNCYLTLLTVFAKAYNPTTAAADPGLPLVTSTNVTDKIPRRSTLKATLDTLISNVTKAISWLPVENINKFRVTKYSACGLLARIYLYMGDYTNAEKYVNMSLQAQHSLLNYNDYPTKDKIPTYDLNPEILWQCAAVGSGSPTFMLYSDDLKSYFDKSDIRYRFLTVTSNNGLGRSTFSGRYNFGITFPEMYLTKAELLARKGSFKDAMDIVNMIRKNRILVSDYKDQIATSGEDALIKVLAERRRELAYGGLRWFDMKRFDQEGRMPEVKRISPDAQTVDASLPPHSPKYTFEIPVRVTMFNPDMELNHP